MKKSKFFLKKIIYYFKLFLFYGENKNQIHAYYHRLNNFIIFHQYKNNFQCFHYNKYV